MRTMVVIFRVECVCPFTSLFHQVQSYSGVPPLVQRWLPPRLLSTLPTSAIKSPLHKCSAAIHPTEHGWGVSRYCARRQCMVTVHRPLVNTVLSARAEVYPPGVNVGGLE